MEGASWVAKKSQIESERHTSKLQNLVQEFGERTHNSVRDRLINDFDGNKVQANADWIMRELAYEAGDLNKRFEALF